MAWKKVRPKFQTQDNNPKIERKGKCPHCKTRGVCFCQETINAAISAGKHGPCTQMCNGPKGKPCGKTIRGGICPCSNC